MQFFGVMSFIVALVSMYLIYVDNLRWAHITFASAMLLFACSLVLSLIEILKSTNALELELSDMEDEEGKSFVDYIKKHI
jgi:hypothetical protein